MASVPWALPLGVADECSASEGVAPAVGYRIRGPLGCATERDHANAGTKATLAGASVDELFGVMFAFESHQYRVRRDGPLWSGQWREEPVQPTEAVRVIDSVIAQGGDTALVEMLSAAAIRLRGGHTGAIFVLMRLHRPVPMPVKFAPAPPAPPPKSASVAPAAAPAAQEPVIDAAAQAAALKSASALGVPFCEECAKAAAHEPEPAAAT